MNWENFFLVCFVVGFSFSVLSFVGGLHRFHLHIHLPKHLHMGGFGHGGVHGVGGAHGAAHGHARTSSGAHFPFINPMTLAAFLTWFGGTGYLLVHLRHIWIFAGFVLATGVCLPSFYFYALLAGVRMTMLQVTAHIMRGMAATNASSLFVTATSQRSKTRALACA